MRKEEDLKRRREEEVKRRREVVARICKQPKITPATTSEDDETAAGRADASRKFLNLFARGSSRYSDAGEQHAAEVMLAKRAPLGSSSRHAPLRFSWGALLLLTAASSRRRRVLRPVLLRAGRGRAAAEPPGRLQVSTHANALARRQGASRAEAERPVSSPPGSSPGTRTSSTWRWTTPCWSWTAPRTCGAAATT